MYRAWNKGLQILFSNSGAGPGRTAKQEQEEISCIHVQTFSGLCAMSDDGVELLMLNVFSPLKDSRVKLQCPEYPILGRTLEKMDENLAS